MKLKVAMTGLKGTALEFFKRELELLVYEYPLEIQNALDQFKQDRNIRNKLLNFLSKRGINMTLDDFLAGFHMVKDVYFFSYTILEEDTEQGNITAEIELSETYFDMIQTVKHLPMGRFMSNRTGQTKKDFQKKWEKIVKGDPYRPITSSVEVVTDGDD